MAIAISDLVYHLNQGYVAYAVLEQWCNDRFGGKVPTERLHNAAYINSAFRDAISMDQIATWSPTARDDFRPILHRQIVPESAEDLGRVDYYKLAFTLFGFRIEAATYLFFSFLLLSSLLLWAGFSRNFLALALLNAYLVAINLVVQSDLFTPNLPSISAYRGFSALAIVPAIHLILCTWHRVRLTSWMGITGLAQTAILIFVIWTRSSGMWALIAIVMIAVLVWLRERANWRLAHAWPLLAVAVALIGLNVYTRLALHPAYFTEQLLPHHMVWHSAFIGLSLHPGWPYTDADPLSDHIAWIPSAKYLAANRPDIHPQATGMRLHEHAVQQLLLQFAWVNPWYMVELYGWWKPVRFLRLYGTAVRPLLWGVPLTVLLLVVIALGCSALWLRRIWPQLVKSALMISGVVAFCSMAPLIWAYPARHVMQDQVLTTTAFLLVLAVSIAGFLLLMGQRHVWIRVKRIPFAHEPSSGVGRLDPPAAPARN
jgi:hypothetical protein